MRSTFKISLLLVVLLMSLAVTTTHAQGGGLSREEVLELLTANWGGEGISQEALEFYLNMGSLDEVRDHIKGPMTAVSKRPGEGGLFVRIFDDACNGQITVCLSTYDESSGECLDLPAGGGTAVFHPKQGESRLTVKYTERYTSWQTLRWRELEVCCFPWWKTVFQTDEYSIQKLSGRFEVFIPQNSQPDFEALL